MRKLLLILGGMAALYAPGELSRLIINYWHGYGLVKPFYLELIWIALGIAVFLYCWIQALRRC